MPRFDLAGTNEFYFVLIARARCGDDLCWAASRLEETLYFEFNGESASGYNYPGCQIVDPPPTGIPVPASSLRLLTGLAALAGLRRRA